MRPATYSFDGVSIDVPRMQVTRLGVPVSLEPKAFDVLLVLLEHRDRLVTKEELLDAVWKDTFVTPNVLTRVVAQLRKALGDDADEPRIIETVARRGYRFVAAVTVEPQGRSEAEPLGTRASQARRRSATTVWAIAVAAAVVAGIGGWLIWRSQRAPAPAQAGSAAATNKRLTTRAGFNGHPAFSPDGRSIAYTSDQTGALEIYVRGLISTGTEHPLTSNGGQNVQPEWSPDGQWIAFHSRQFGGIWVVPSGGGNPQQIVDFGSSPSWAPDSHRLVFASDAGGFAEQSTLWIVRRDGSERSQLTDASLTPGGAVYPAWSRNGKFIAYINAFGVDSRRLCVLALDAHKVHRLTETPIQSQPAFGPGDRWVYALIGTSSANLAIGRTPIDPSTGAQTGETEVLLPVTGLTNGLSIAADGSLAYSLDSDDDNLWRIDVDTSGKPGEPVRVTHDAVRNNRPAFASTGRIAYQQISAGHPITTWILDEQGRAEALLPGAEAMNPQWSADGRRLLVVQGKSAVWVDLATRRTTSAAIAIDYMGFPRLSPDDREIAFHRIDADGLMRAWIQPLDGKPVRLLAEDAEGVGFPVWSPDGQRLALEVKRRDQTVIGLVARNGGPVSVLVPERGNSWPHSWSPDGKRIAYAGQRNGVWNVFDVDVATRTSRQLTHFTLPIGFIRYPAWSPRGDRIVFERQIQSATIWTMKVE